MAKVQPIESVSVESDSVAAVVVKPVVKSILRRLFRISAAEKDELPPPMPVVSTAVVVTEEFEPSSVCLANMVKNYIEENNENQVSLVRCGRNRCNCFVGGGSDGDDGENDSVSPTVVCDFLKRLVVSTSVNEMNVLADTARVVAEKNKVRKRKDELRKIVMEGLMALGYDSAICKSKWEKSASFPAGATRTSKLSKVDGGVNSVVKVEVPEVSKDRGERNASAVAAATTTVKEENGVKSIFMENIHTSGAYSAREESLRNEEALGKLKFKCVSNDGKDEHMIWLIWLKNIFARQLPNMPKEYIVRLVMDRNHKSVMVIRRGTTVVGGITYRPYKSQKFGEIAFCAITADEQVKGYGTRLMNHLKEHARDVDGLTHFLTYADNNAVGYFIKQGFTKGISLEKDVWHGYIKDYDGGILMECKIDPKLPYTNLSAMIHCQRQAIDEKIRELSNCHTVYTGIDFQKKEACVPKKVVKVDDIPGLREAGWTPDQYGHSRFKQTITSSDGDSYQKSLTAFMRSLLKTMHDHPDAWPFKEPVDARDVPDYYDIIKNPIDLKTMSKRVETEVYYVTFEMFVADVRRMFDNARTYNSPETIYSKCATRLESHFTSIANLQTGVPLPK